MTEDNEDMLLRSVALQNVESIRIARQRAERQAEATLLEQADLLNLTHDSIFVRDLNGAIRYWNRAAEKSYGWTEEQALGRVAHDLLKTVFPASLEQIEEEVMRTDRWDGEVVHTRKDGSQVVVASRWSLKRDERGAPVAILVTNNDITDRKRAEQERERSYRLQADLAHINRVTTMGELTASLAHEVNQPIAAAVTNANTCVRWLAGESPDIEEARDAARRMVKDANRAAEIIRRIRLLFKKSALQHELLNVNEVVNEIVVLLRGEAMRSGVSIRSQLASDLPQVMGDRVQLQQVLMNLVMNGIDAMKDVDSSRELTLSSHMDRNDQVMVSVSDTGIGLPPEMAQIFDAFFTTKPHGTGMGLAISRTIIEAHGGRLWAASNSGRGAIFHFTLPTTRRTRRSDG